MCARYNDKLYILKKNLASKATIQFPSPITHYPLHTTRTKGSDLIIIKDFRKVHVFHTLCINIIIRTCRLWLVIWDTYTWYRYIYRIFIIMDNRNVHIKYVQIKIYTKPKQFFRKTREKLQKIVQIFRHDEWTSAVL